MVSIRFVSLIGITPVPAGQFAVVSGVISGTLDDWPQMYDKAGFFKREYWETRRIFKRKANAEKYKQKLVQQGWNDFLTTNGLINLN